MNSKREMNNRLKEDEMKMALDRLDKLDPVQFNEENNISSRYIVCRYISMTYLFLFN